MGVLKVSLSQTENWSAHLVRWNDATATSIGPLEQVGPSGLTNFCNPLLYGHDPNDIGNKGYGYAFRGFPSSYLIV